MPPNNSHQMHHSVRRPADGLKHSDAVEERLSRQDRLWSQLVEFLTGQDCVFAGLFGDTEACSGDGGGGGAFEGHEAETDEDAGHGAGCAHDAASAALEAALALNLSCTGQGRYSLLVRALR